MNQTLRRAVWGVLAILLAGYAAIHLMVWRHALTRLADPPPRPADAALVLGNRASWEGKPNPCLTGRVDAGVALAKQGLVRALVMSGGVDKEDGRVEAEVMRAYARRSGYAGPLL
ncbi:MAG: YdcF family protein, partial [Variovorax sp.]